MYGSTVNGNSEQARLPKEIRNAIFTGKFPPGYQLKEEELAQQLDVSRTPVRQAIRSLADQGLVEIRANRRSYVTDINEVQFEELFDLLSFLESYSAGLAAAKISDEAIARLKELNAGMEETIKTQGQRPVPEIECRIPSHYP